MKTTTKEELNLAKIGFIALIDEATGYQEVRHKKALDKMLSPQEVCSLWLQEIKRLYGEKVFRESKCQHIRGWYYPQKATRFSDGSVGIVSSFQHNGIRKKQLLTMILRLRAR